MRLDIELFFIYRLVKMKVEPTLSGSGGNTNDLSHLTVPAKKVDSVPSNPFFKKKTVVKE
jgi:hypothetical protein